ncbi:hypothetical protein SAMN04488000_1395, partial [Lentzea albida]
ATLFGGLTPLLRCGPLLVRLGMGPHRHRNQTKQQAAALSNRRAIYLPPALAPISDCRGLGQSPRGSTQQQQAARKRTTDRTGSKNGLNRLNHRSLTIGELQGLPDRVPSANQLRQHSGNISPSDRSPRQPRRSKGHQPSRRIVNQRPRPKDRPLQIPLPQILLSQLLGLQINRERRIHLRGVSGFDPHRRHLQEPPHPRLHGSGGEERSGPVVHGVLAGGTGSGTSPSGEHGRVSAVQIRGDRVQIGGLQVAQHRNGSGFLHVTKMIGIADQCGGGVPTGGQLLLQEQRDLPVPTGYDYSHGPTVDQ